jgi:hypothetical protein
MPPAGPRVNSAKTGYPQLPFARGTGEFAPTCRANESGKSAARSS